MPESAFFWSSAPASPTSSSTFGAHLTADCYMCMYHIFLKICHQLWPEKIVTWPPLQFEGDKYLDSRDETLERTAKPQSVLLGHFLRRNGGFCMDSSSRLSHQYQ